jgi:DNA-directed RNA polymerase specialized sigma24 family protein
VSDLAAYVRHAELFGTECVYETAQDGWLNERRREFPPIDLMRMTPAERDEFLAEREQAFAAYKRDVEHAVRWLQRLRLELDSIEAGRMRGRYHVGRCRRRSRAETRVAAQLLADEGLTRVEIAEKMGVSVKTIDNALSPGAVQTTADLRSAVRGMKPTANEGGEMGGLRPPELGSTMRDDDEGQMPLWKTA